VCVGYIHVDAAHLYRPVGKEANCAGLCTDGMAVGNARVEEAGVDHTTNEGALVETALAECGPGSAGGWAQCPCWDSSSSPQRWSNEQIEFVREHADGRVFCGAT
jgi:hypothetical protein